MLLLLIITYKLIKAFKINLALASPILTNQLGIECLFDLFW